MSLDEKVVFTIEDVAEERTYHVACESPSLQTLRDKIRVKLDLDYSAEMELTYKDSDGDDIVLETNDDLIEASNRARHSGSNEQFVLRLVLKQRRSTNLDQ
ncbi:TPA: hypothetical protein N0F65_000203 [Lagenidium giganteum]|uniref:PB1 domain-containing protein n=1 Tax=Lagenidium giganteum TaxID=4803 RepID=A0AAV2YH74_9STRA|nr:TPA: hypothetical protein N0F65_000203 [Lagenidium giganteum]